MQPKRLHILENAPILKAIATLALPTIVGMIVQIFYNITDTFFVGKLNDPLQMAAVAIALPIFMMQTAVAGIFGNGGASYLSRLLGKKDYETAQKTAATAWYSCAGVSVVLAVVGALNLGAIVRLTGASPETAVFAEAYLRIIFLGNLVLMLNFATGQLLRAEGAAKEAMFGMLLGTITNIVLDPLFILVWRQGVAGAAIATVIGNGVGLLYCLSHYLRRQSVVHLSITHFAPGRTMYAEIFKIGIPSSVTHILMSFGMAMANKLATGYGDTAVAALGISMRVFTIPIFVFIGLAIGIQPLIGYCYGAKNFARLKHVMLTAGSIAGALSVVFVLLFAIFPRQLMLVFIRDPEIVATGSMILRAMMLAIPFAALQMLLMNALQAMGQGLPSLIVSLSRQGLIYIPALFLLNWLFGFSGLIYAMPLADLGTTLLALFFFLRIAGHFEPPVPTQPVNA